MGKRVDIWTYLIITAITLLIWYWANGETRVEETFNVTVEFKMSNPEGWRLDQPTARASLSVEGSQRAVNDAEQNLSPLAIELEGGAGLREVDLLVGIREHPDLRQAGISVINVTPSTVELDVEAMVTVPARVRPDLPGVQTVNEVLVEPSQVELTMPERLRRMLPADISVVAVVERRELDRLTPEARHTLENVPVRLPDRLPPDSPVTIEPSRVRLQFTIRSKIRTLALEAPVRIKILRDPDDEETVEIEPKQLRSVTISAPVELIEKIEAKQAIVVAQLYLKSSELESRIESKPITCFMAMLDNETGVAIDATVGGSTERPTIALTITSPDDD